MLGAAALAVLLVATDRLTQEGLGSVILLLIALTYIQADIHLHRGLAWVGLLIGAAYVVTLVACPYEWTLAGMVIALALVAQVLSGRRADASSR
jgi:hypothetical protein